MKCTGNQSFRCSFNFIFKIFFQSLVFSTIISLLEVALSRLTKPSIRQLNSLHINYLHNNIILYQLNYNFNLLQKKMLIHIFLLKYLSSLVETALLISITIFCIEFIVYKKEINIFSLIKRAICIFPSVILLTLILNLLIQIGLMLFIIPGIILITYFSLSPIILIIKNIKLKESLLNSFHITKKHYLIFLFPVFFYLLSKLFVIILFICFHLFSMSVSNTAFHIINNFIFCMLIIYLFYLYKNIHIE
ncbi:UPF0259 membrane protein YciC [Buchnera aphidicola (Thelaxes suberi)]|uniref:YciC family protein n=1 Tax=Buchnera aphidicola TaxID=9 RepID=UPI0034640768